jgi:steroid delta-isomerase-like uncharacterized protein
MTREEIVDLVARWQMAFEDKDLDGYAKLYAPHVELQSPMAGTVTGRDGAVRVMETFLAAFPNTTWESEPPIIDGHRVAVVLTVSGTNFGGLMGLPPSGRSFRFGAVFLLDVEGGLIVRERRNYDFTGLLVQVGVLKAKPAS